QVVLHVLLGGEHRVLIAEEQLLKLRVLRADIVRDLAVVEDVPLQGGADLDRAALPAPHVAELERSQVRREEGYVTDQGERREAPGLGTACRSRLGRRLLPGAPNTRPAPQQIGRNAPHPLAR